MQVVGFDANFDERPHQCFERVGIVVDAAQQHCLADDRDTGIDDAGDGGARVVRQFARMVRVQPDENGFRSLREARRPAPS